MRIVILFIILVSGSINAQNSLKKLLNQYNNESIPYISATGLEKIKDTVLIFDAREKNEYLISHLENAVHVGYDSFAVAAIVEQKIAKNSHIVVYCSLGIRSEDVAEQLKKEGYTNIQNLYGGIFEWKNNGYPVINSKNELTEEIHTYSKEWSKWLLKGEKKY
ncbi:rhodanese-like domain-containing protein [Aquimarina longa]|uniref:rhodanese-like domain-containing protein n=1 Tax=Aquimarina longa TaxID=1080221 RepID=UPI0007805FB1|nr:rhodanese-like domain-containing protein [Aquimarina longa]